MNGLRDRAVRGGLLMALMVLMACPRAAAQGDDAPFGVGVAAADGSGATMVVPGGFHGDWSPDGTEIAFARHSRRGMELFRAAADGSNPVPMVADPALWLLAPHWSPDGSLVAFSGARLSADQSEISIAGIARADGSGVVWTADAGQGYPVAEAWSPNGHALAYAESVGGHSTLWAVDADGANPRELAEVPGRIEGLDWSPDGETVAIVASESENGPIRTRLVVVSADGRGSTTIVDASAGDELVLTDRPSWSIDGLRVAAAGSNSIVIASADGSGITELDLGTLQPYAAEWSHDGSRIAFSATDGAVEGGATGTDIFVVHPDGSGLRSVAATPMEDLAPRWSPDDALILFSSEPLGD